MSMPQEMINRAIRISVCLLENAKTSTISGQVIEDLNLFLLWAGATKKGCETRCTCDDIGEGDCPVHARENALQDEMIALRNQVAAYEEVLATRREHEARAEERALDNSVEWERHDAELALLWRTIEEQLAALKQYVAEITTKENKHE